MDLTSNFNAAAGGPSGEAGPVDSGPSPQGPNLDSFATSVGQQAEPEGQTPFTHDSLGEFNESVHAEVSPETAPPQGEYTLESAQAELDALEAGRPKPTPRHNLNPPAKLKKIADTAAERKREARIGALEAYLQSEGAEATPGYLDELKNRSDLEPTW